MKEIQKEVLDLGYKFVKLFKNNFQRKTKSLPEKIHGILTNEFPKEMSKKLPYQLLKKLAKKFQDESGRKQNFEGAFK